MGLFSADGAYDRLQKLIRKIRPYRQYRALLTQAGVLAPTAVVSPGNELGLVTYTYIGEGVYLVTGNFPLGKTHIFCPNNVSGTNTITNLTATEFELRVLNESGIPKDDFLINCPIRIEVDY